MSEIDRTGSKSKREKQRSLTNNLRAVHLSGCSYIKQIINIEMRKSERRRPWWMPDATVD